MWLNNARASPRVTPAGGLEWYHGDMFPITFVIESVKDFNGYPVTLTEGSKIDLNVIRRDDVVVHREYTDFPADSIKWEIDEDMVNTLTPGNYKLRLVVSHGGTVTTTHDADITILR